MLLSRDRLEVYLPVYEAETASGSQAQPLPAEIQLKRLINAASKNEMAASGTKFFARNTAVVAEKSYDSTYQASAKTARPSIQPDRSRRGGLTIIGSKIDNAITPAMT